MITGSNQTPNRKATRRLVWAFALSAVLGFSLSHLAATFTALCGGGTACAYVVGDKFGAQTVERIRTNFNDHETRISAALVGLSSSVEKEIALFDGTTGKLVERATGTGFVRVASGVYQTPTAHVTLAELPTGLAQIFKATVTLTNQQIKDLPTTPITLVAAQGAGTQATALFVNVAGNTSAGAYTNIDLAASMVIAYSGGPAVTGFVVNDAAIAGSKTRLTDLIGTTTNRTVRLTPYADTEGVNGWGPVAEVKPTSGSTNTPIVVSIDNVAAGALTGGNAANGLTFTVVYLVL